MWTIVGKIGAATGIASLILSVVALVVSVYTWRAEREVDLRVDTNLVLGSKHGRPACYYRVTVRNPTSFAVDIAKVEMTGYGDPSRVEGVFDLAVAPRSGPKFPTRLAAHGVATWEIPRFGRPETRPIRARVVEASTLKTFYSADVRGYWGQRYCE
jgi:hypothetical protein